MLPVGCPAKAITPKNKKIMVFKPSIGKRFSPKLDIPLVQNIPLEKEMALIRACRTGDQSL
jgi:hypothetical protein